MYINIFPESYFDTQRYNSLPRVRKREKTIISFTTVPGRIDKSYYTIASLLNQSRKVDEICIYIPLQSHKGVEYIIPNWMLKLQKNLKSFKIKRCEKDWGPATKLIPALLEHTENCVIIYVDDDTVYNKNMVENLISYSNRYPKCAICNQGWNVERWNSKQCKTDKIFSNATRYFPKVDPYGYQFVDVLQGFSGVLVKNRFFDIPSLIQTEKYPKQVFYVDDVYISGHLNNNKIHRISTTFQNGIPYMKELVNGFLLRRAENSLSSEQNDDLVNDKIASLCFDWVKQIKICGKI